MVEASLQHVLITGLPRSGSSVLAALQDGLPDNLNLNSPQWHSATAAKLASSRSFCKWLVGEFYWQHKLAYEGARLYDYRRPDGSPLFDGHSIAPLSPPDTTPIARHNLSPHFTLSVRHTTLYTAILPELLYFEHFRVIAVVRNPIDIILSWLSYPNLIPTYENPYGLHALWPELNHLCASSLPEFERLAQIVELFFQRYVEQRDFIEIIRYEDLACDPMQVCALFGASAPSSNLSQLKTSTQRRKNSMLDTIKDALQQSGACWKLFYPDAL